jgi:hypothetical protein
MCVQSVQEKPYRQDVTIHNNRGEIDSLLEYVVGRSSGQYGASHPSWYRRSSKEKRIHIFADASPVADFMGETSRFRGLQQAQDEQQYNQYQHFQHRQEHQF